MCIIITKVELRWLQGADVLHIVKYYPPSNLSKIIIGYEDTEDRLKFGAWLSNVVHLVHHINQEKPRNVWHFWKQYPLENGIYS